MRAACVCVCVCGGSHTNARSLTHTHTHTHKHAQACMHRRTHTRSITHSIMLHAHVVEREPAAIQSPPQTNKRRATHSCQQRQTDRVHACSTHIVDRSAERMPGKGYSPRAAAQHRLGSFNGASTAPVTRKNSSSRARPRPPRLAAVRARKPVTSRWYSPNLRNTRRHLDRANSFGIGAAGVPPPPPPSLIIRETMLANTGPKTLSDIGTRHVIDYSATRDRAPPRPVRAWGRGRLRDERVVG